MAEVSPRDPLAVASSVLVVDITCVLATTLLDKVHHVEPPAEGKIDTSAAIGWLGLASSVFIFGSFGVLIKTPAVVQANCEAMVFQCYCSLAVCITSTVIWLCAARSSGLHMTPSSLVMGAVFALLWISSQLCSYNAIQILGYAAGPAIWIGLTIIISFIWGVVVFDDPVPSWPGACAALLLLVIGVFLAAASGQLGGKKQRELSLDSFDETPGDAILTRESNMIKGSTGNQLFGLACCMGSGFMNGSIMVPLTCFADGCTAIGVEKYPGDVIAAEAFLPSLALGILIVQPVLFAMYFCRSLIQRRLPEFHFKAVALPGLLTGAFWGMGNFTAMYSTVYLGQAIGFPLTQGCLLVNGLWGILYYKEIRGASAICLFVLSAVAIIGGGALDGIFG